MNTPIENQFLRDKGKSKLDEYLFESQFELSDELLPSPNPERLNLERRMIIHPMSIVKGDPLAIVETPPLFRRFRRPRPHNVSSFVGFFGSETGQFYYIDKFIQIFLSNCINIYTHNYVVPFVIIRSSSKKSIIFHQKQPFNDISDMLNTSLYLCFLKWLTEGIKARHRQM